MRKVTLTIAVGLFAVTVWASHIAMAADIVQAKIYDGNENCEGDPDRTATVNLAGRCYNIGQSQTSVKYTCTEYQSYQGRDCEGEPDSMSIMYDCLSTLPDTSTRLECASVPDDKLIIYSNGDSSCSEDEEVGNLAFEDVYITGTCQPYPDGALQSSRKFSVTDNYVNVTFFGSSAKCTGGSHTFTLEIGKCTLLSAEALYGRRRRRLQEEGSEFLLAAKVAPAVEGTTLSNSPPEETIPDDHESPDDESPEDESPEDESPDDDGNPGNNNTGNGNDGTASSSVSTFTLVAIFVGVLGLMC